MNPIPAWVCWIGLALNCASCVWIAWTNERQSRAVVKILEGLVEEIKEPEVLE